MNPTVSLNVVFTQNTLYSSYKTENIERILGINGFDLVEIDNILMLDYVKSGIIQKLNKSEFNLD